MIHRALRYLVLARLRNRVRMWMRRLRTPVGLLGVLVLLLVIVGFASASDMGTAATTSIRAAAFTAILGFFLVMGVLSGLGQRGLVFSPADLDFLFPGPFRRRHLIAYQFLPHYLLAVFAALLFFVFGARNLPSPGLFFLGACLCQITTAHVTAIAAEISMLLADRLFRQLRMAVVVLVVIFTVGTMLLVIAGLSGWGDVPTRLQGVMASDAARVLLYPAQCAVALGVEPGWGAHGVALAGLLACTVASFCVVLLLPVDPLERSFYSSRRVHRRLASARRGMGPVKVTRSARGPRGRLFQGVGAVTWLNWMTLRRQLRVMIGGLFVVVMVFLIVGTRATGRSDGATGRMLMFLLAMVPLWMPLPIGFRLPREQLVALRALPLPPGRLAGALLGVPMLAPLSLQCVGVVALVATGHVEPVAAPLALLAYLAVSGTLLSIEGMFMLRGARPNAVNLLQHMAQLCVQMLALVPGILVLLVSWQMRLSLPIALALTALGQGSVAYLNVRSLGRQFQDRDVAVAAS